MHADFQRRAIKSTARPNRLGRREPLDDFGRLTQQAAFCSKIVSYSANSNRLEPLGDSARSPQISRSSTLFVGKDAWRHRLICPAPV
jgi:hypothetical protein